MPQAQRRPERGDRIRPTPQKRLLAIGVDIPPQGPPRPAYAASFVEQEIKKYEAPIKASGIVIE